MTDVALRSALSPEIEDWNTTVWERLCVVLKAKLRLLPPFQRILFIRGDAFENAKA